MIGPLKPRTSSTTGLRITSRFQGRCDDAKGGWGAEGLEPKRGALGPSASNPQGPQGHSWRPRLMGEGLAGTKGF